MPNSYKKNEEKAMSTGDPATISSFERKRIEEAVERSDTEKFHLFTRMMRIRFMLKKAVIIKK